METATDIAIVSKPHRPSGCPPRCRQCGRIVHMNQAGPALDRFCKRHHLSEARAELTLIAWATGAPFRSLEWTKIRTERNDG